MKTILTISSILLFAIASIGQYSPNQLEPYPSIEEIKYTSIDSLDNQIMIDRMMLAGKHQKAAGGGIITGIMGPIVGVAGYFLISKYADDASSGGIDPKLIPLVAGNLIGLAGFVSAGSSMKKSGKALRGEL